MPSTKVFVGGLGCALGIKSAFWVREYGCRVSNFRGLGSAIRRDTMSSPGETFKIQPMVFLILRFSKVMDNIPRKWWFSQSNIINLIF